MVECLVGTWNPTLTGALLDQRVEEFLSMQQFLVLERPQSMARDGWEWIGAQFLVRGTFKKLCKGLCEENQSINRACRFIWRQKSLSKCRSLFGFSSEEDL